MTVPVSVPASTDTTEPVFEMTEALLSAGTEAGVREYQAE